MLYSFSMFQSILKRASKQITTDFLVYSMAIRKSSPPVAFIELDILVNFGIAGGLTEPVEFAISVFFVIKEMSNVEIAVGVYFHPETTLLVIVKLAFVEFTLLVEVDTSSFPLLPIHLSKVNLVIALY